DGQGLTPFKIGAEYTIITALAATMYLLHRKAADFDPRMRELLILCIGVKIASELAFTLYADPYGLSNFMGHIFKIVSSYLFLRAIVETGLRRPQAMIFGSLEREKMLAEEVQRHATTLDAVLDASPDPVMMFDGDCRFRFASRAAETFFRRPAAELVGKTWRENGLPEATMAPIEDLCRRVLAGGESATHEYSIVGRDGICCLEAQVSPVQRGGDSPTAVVAVVRDISVRKSMEEDLKASLDDNRVLMMEVHHRVKNNLQIVSSILQMQGWRLHDPEMRGQFEEACGRILSLAKVHEMLYKEDNASAVDFGRYIQTLSGELFAMYGVRPDWVSLKLSGAGLFLSLDRAVPLALIVHELITNSIKHAFDEKGGELSIAIAEDGPDFARLVVSDDGKGMVEAEIEGESSSLGMRMVAVLVKQIDGSITFDRAAGTTVTIRFPVAGVQTSAAELSVI
ncbi:MAG TPA: MASE3 domain-containing protein, partial [Candidatus Omnitrophota bacterium]|nr:MASE3 domain-containing protein [Candidatus Omnitrophota bacterium]